jgi:hypothetical protein
MTVFCPMRLAEARKWEYVLATQPEDGLMIKVKCFVCCQNLEMRSTVCYIVEITNERA